MNKDAHRHASSTVIQSMQEPHGKAGKETLVAEVNKHLPARLEPLSGKGTAAPELQARGVKPNHQLPAEKEHMSGEVEAAQSEGAKDKDGEVGGKAEASEREREKNLMLESNQALLGGSGKKRPRSSSSEGASSERPSNKARRDGQEGEPSLRTEENVLASPGEPAEESGDGKEIASLLTSNAAPPIPEERVPEETDLSGEVRVDVEKYVSFKAPSEHVPAFHVESLGLPLGSYHPTQPYTTIAIVAGSQMGDTQDVRFELDEEQAMLVKRWTDRFEGLECVSSTFSLSSFSFFFLPFFFFFFFEFRVRVADVYVCSKPCISITLICTHVPDAQSSNDAEEVAEDTTQKMIRWPSGGKFWITVEADGRPPVSISVSPPDLVRVHPRLHHINRFDHYPIYLVMTRWCYRSRRMSLLMYPLS